MTVYQEGHIKHNIDNGEVAIRTHFGETDERIAQMAWIIASARFGVRHAPTSTVADWPDLYTPPAANG